METDFLINEVGMYLCAVSAIVSLFMFIREFFIPKEQRSMTGVMIFAFLVLTASMWFSANFAHVDPEFWLANLFKTNWP
jgi:hypothetical protein